MSRIKTQILSKLKEYASKMGTNTMGGDDYTSKKKGGLRDFDGYDNVDYNKDMPMDEATKGDVMRAVKGKPNPYSLVVIKRGKVIYQKDIKNPQDAPAVYSVIRKHMDKGERIHIEDRTGKIVFKEGINEGMFSTIDQIRQDSKDVRDFVKNVFKDREFKKMSNDKEFIKYLKSIYEDVDESINEGKIPQPIQNLIDDMVKNKIQRRSVRIKSKSGLARFMKDVKPALKNKLLTIKHNPIDNDELFISLGPKAMKESKGVPSNYMQGRTSDYHTALRGKNRDYSGGTNFKKKNHGQPDVEEDDEDQETNHLKSESGKKKSEKNYKDWKNTNEGFDKVEHLSLLNKALRAMPGSQKQKDIIRKLNKVRKAGGMRPLKEQGIVEYASRLSLSYIADKESELDGTPEDKMAIDEIGMFPITNYMQGIIPSNFIDTTTRQKKERLRSTLKDLKSTLNYFWKQHKIPYRIK